MDDEKPSKLTTYGKIATAICGGLFLVLITAQFAFGLPRQIAMTASTLIMQGYFLFWLIALLLSGRRAAAAACLACMLIWVLCFYA